jgi:hypothetical protein
MPTLKLCYRSGVVGMGREPLDESIEGSIGKTGEIAPGIHLLASPNDRPNRHAQWELLASELRDHPPLARTMF